MREQQAAHVHSGRGRCCDHHAFSSIINGHGARQKILGSQGSESRSVETQSFSGIRARQVTGCMAANRGVFQYGGTRARTHRGGAGVRGRGAAGGAGRAHGRACRPHGRSQQQRAARVLCRVSRRPGGAASQHSRGQGRAAHTIQEPISSSCGLREAPYSAGVTHCRLPADCVVVPG